MAFLRIRADAETMIIRTRAAAEKTSTAIRERDVQAALVRYDGVPSPNSSGTETART